MSDERGAAPSIPVSITAPRSSLTRSESSTAGGDTSGTARSIAVVVAWVDQALGEVTMSALLSTGRLARSCAKHARGIVAAWVVGLVLLAVATVTIGGELSGDEEFIGRPESVRGEALLDARMPAEGFATELVIVHSEAATVDDPAYRQVVEALAADLRAMTGFVRDAPTYYDAVAAGDERAPLLVSDDRRTMLIPVARVGDPDAFVERVAELPPVDGYEAYTIGEASFDRAESELLESDLIRAELFGLPIALLVLIVVFGALVAAGVPLALAMVTIVGSAGVAVVLSAVTEMSVYALNMITMIGMAVGIDYALFVVDRFREERRHGQAKLDAIEAAGSTASRAVLFSGGTVAVGLLGMFLLPTTLFRSLGIGAILAVVVAVTASLTLVPALLALLGDRLDWPRRRRAASAVAPRTRFWDAIVRVVMARPVLSVIVAAGLLLAAAFPFTEMERGTAGIESLPESDLKRAYELMAGAFPAGLVEPAEIVIDAEREPAVEAAIDDLVTALAADGAFGPITDRRWNDEGTLAALEVPLTVDGNSPAADRAIERLREEIIPATFAGSEATVLVTGDPAENADFNALVEQWTPRVFALVLGLSFLLLLLAFRSIVAPLKAIAMNLLSVGAAYGSLVFVFQWGHGTELFGVQRTPTIEAWLPIFLFCILFGLSMDYHVFLLSRIREVFVRTGDNRTAVAAGLGSTARIITGAALIMVVVFSAFASAELVFFQQLGFGLAVAILIDATLVRCVLVPASMALLGDWNWYLPRWLGWLPDLRIEGPAEPMLSRASS